MARIRTVLLRCDLCGEEAEHEQVEIRVGKTSGTLDLCERHYQACARPLADAVASLKSWKRDRHRQGWKRRPGPFRCVIPGCPGSVLKNAATLEQHLLRLHDMTLAAYAEAYGLTPLTPEEAEAVVVEVRCEVNGCEQVYSTAQGFRWPHQAMRAHMWGHHGIKWKPGS